VRHVVEDLLHVLRARADAGEEVLSFLVELVGVVAEQQLTEAVDREDRRLEIVRKDAEETNQFILGDRTALDVAPPEGRVRCNGRA